jgi:hypothetical protein
MIYKINACLGKQLLLKASNQNSTNNIGKTNKATTNLEAHIFLLEYPDCSTQEKPETK